MHFNVMICWCDGPGSVTVLPIGLVIDDFNKNINRSYTQWVLVARG
jgi:hypothetical protein